MPPRRVALVTGAAGGIGRVTVPALLRDGFAVFASDRALASLPCASDVAFDAFSADVTDEIQVAEMVAACRKRFGGLDVAVHLAGATGKGPLTDVSLAEWREVMDVNLTSAFLVARAAGPLLRERQGALLLTSSTNARNGGSALSGPAYAVAKAGIINLCRYLAKEWARDRVRVNCVAPGPVDTPMLQRFAADVRADIDSLVPLGRAATAAEVAEIIAFLCSPRAAYLTGTVTNVSGGLVLD